MSSVVNVIVVTLLSVATGSHVESSASASAEASYEEDRFMFTNMFMSDDTTRINYRMNVGTDISPWAYSNTPPYESDGESPFVGTLDDCFKLDEDEDDALLGFSLDGPAIHEDETKSTDHGLTDIPFFETPRTLIQIPISEFYSVNEISQTGSIQRNHKPDENGRIDVAVGVGNRVLMQGFKMNRLVITNKGENPLFARQCWPLNRPVRQLVRSEVSWYQLSNAKHNDEHVSDSSPVSVAVDPEDPIAEWIGLSTGESCLADSNAIIAFNGVYDVRLQIKNRSEQPFSTLATFFEVSYSQRQMRDHLLEIKFADRYYLVPDFVDWPEHQVPELSSLRARQPSGFSPRKIRAPKRMQPIKPPIKKPAVVAVETEPKCFPFLARSWC